MPEAVTGCDTSNTPAWPMKRALAIGSVVVVAVAVVVLLLSGTGVIGGSGNGYQVEALFDNAAFAVPGEEVRVAGAPVGTISGAVGHKAEPGRGHALDQQQRLHAVLRERDLHDPAAVADRRALRGLLARDPRPSRLKRIRSGYGAGSYLLPVTQTSSPIDPDIVQDISQDSVRESLSVILNELGTGLAGRGSDLNAVILRADPALAQTEAVFKILGSQNKLLAQLATDSDRCWRRWPRPATRSPTSSCRPTPRRPPARSAAPISRSRSGCCPRSSSSSSR